MTTNTFPPALLYFDIETDRGPFSFSREGTIIDAEIFANVQFDTLTESTRLEEIYYPNFGYTGKVYTITVDKTNRRREILVYRVSTLGPKPIIKPKA